MKFRTLGLSVSAGLVATLTLGACNEDGAGSDDDNCVSDEEFFTENVYTPILSQTCEKCHTPSGQANGTSFILRGAEWGPDFMQQNMEVFANVAKLEYDGTPWVLLKPTLGIDHEGGLVIQKDGDEYNTFVEMIERFDNPTVCADDGAAQEEFFEGVELLDEVATLRKSVLALAGRLPTIEEEDYVRANGFDGVDAVLDNVMQEPVFNDRIIEVYNDFFLTDRYYPDLAAIDLLDSCDPAEGDECRYPEAYWFDALPEGEREYAASAANRALAREPLQLISYVVKNDLPYTEILTADYTMVNPYSARSLGVFDQVTWTNPNDENEWQQVKIPGVPHAGALTTTVWMVRFPTTETNRNRHRSRMLADFFLATDFQALGSRPVDAASIQGLNPTLNNESCTVCHAAVDPIAGAFQNWDDLGRYEPMEEGWYADMRVPGYGDVEMPFENTPSALAWLTREVVKDRRFAVSAIRIMYKGLTGQEPLKDPDDPNADGYLEAVKAKKIQNQIFDEIAQDFIDSNYNLKEVVKGLVKTPYYRASNAYDLDETREKELKDLGTGRLLIPEQLNRKIVAATGFPWRNGNGVDDDSPDYLVDDDQYMLFYGGIDSDSVVDRITEPNGVMANVAKRMANEMSCLAVPQDFAKAPADRVLLPLVERTLQPEDDNGFDVPAAGQAIRANIQFLTQRLWGEYLELDDPEIDRIYELFVNVWKDGQAGMDLPFEEGGYGEGLGFCGAGQDFWTGEDFPEDRVVFDDPEYTVRAWMAVTTYMLSDYRFLVE